MSDEDKTAEELAALLKDLNAYANPRSFYDPDLPLLHNLRVIRANDPDKRIVIDVDIHGLPLTRQIRTHFLDYLRRQNESELLSHFGTQDWDDACKQLLADADYQDSEFEMYYFFARHFPKLLIRVYNLLLMMSAISAYRDVQNEREKRQSDPHVKEIIAPMMREMEKELYEMLEATSKGRPPGSTKSPEEKARQAAEFEKQIEDAIRRLRSASGTLPTKTAVAKELGIGGLSPRTGTDSSLTSFNNKLKRLEVDYGAIVGRLTD
jgi:hypothetical protein